MARNMRMIGALCGFAAISLFVAFYSIAMIMDSEYVFMENYLSDLGVREGAWAFNSGVIIAGALFIALDLLAVAPAVGLDRAGTVSVGLLVLSGAFLISIGVFTEDAGDLHGIVSYGFFLTMIVALGVLSFSLYRTRALGRPALVATIAAFVFGLALLPFGGTPAVETLAVLAILAWGLFMSSALFLTERSNRAA